MKVEKYKITSKIISKKLVYFITRPDGSVVNSTYDEDEKKIKGYLDRLFSMGYCTK